MSENFDGNAINPNNGNEYVNKSNTFNLVIGIATLLIAILGATFAYFTATARSNEGDVTVKSAYVSISYDGGTEIKATNLIPATQQVALKKYQKEVAVYDPEADGDINLDYDYEKNEKDRRCVDSNGREVCYVYQFSIVSDGAEGSSAEILATLTVDKNQFENLSYVLYEVDFREDPEDPTKILTDKYGINIVDKWELVSDFPYFDTNPDNVDYTTVGFEKFEKPEDILGESGEFEGKMKPIACLFGRSDDYADVDKDDPARCKPYPVTNGIRHTYQLVIWLNETGDVQEEQGMAFEGTVAIEVVGGVDTSEYEDGKITGKE